jgi:hypothetical protein
VTDVTWLSAAIGDYVNRSDVYAAIPNLITLTEAQLNRRLTQPGVPSAVARVTSSISHEWETAPADMQFFMGMTIFDPTLQTWTPIEPVTPFGVEVIRGYREAWPMIPGRVAVVGGNFQFSPVPDQAYQVNVQYIQRIPALDLVANPSNWVIAEYPDVYLYGCLAQSAGYFPDMAVDARIKGWKAGFDLACGECVLAERAKRGPKWTPAFRASDTPPNFGRRTWSFNINTGQ